MIHEFGDRERFAIELGRVIDGSPATGLRVVRLWAAGRELSCDDDHAFVPQFCLALEAEITWLLSARARDLP